MRTFFSILGPLLLGVLAWAAGPMPDTFFVHFTDPVVVNKDLTLPPGDYKFQRIVRPTDPAVFTIIDTDHNKVIGTTGPAELASRADSYIHDKTVVVLDQVEGKNYLDAASLQGFGHTFVFQVPPDVRETAVKQGKQIKLEAQAGGID